MARPVAADAGSCANGLIISGVEKFSLVCLYTSTPTLNLLNSPLYPNSYVVSVAIVAVSEASKLVLFPTKSTGIISLLATIELNVVVLVKNAGTLTNNPTTDCDNAGISWGSNAK